ncbi:MAG: protein translocase subunit SecD [Actinomycetales bacterium]|nr:protein translocase subunit SecD [Actinomycetales bacterium]
MFAILFAGVTWSDATWTPKLALDLEGGTQIILTPVTEDNEAITPDVINQAIAIIRQRVDASGVAEAEITSQGGGNIVVGLPGQPDEATLDLVRTPAVMDFRSVLTMDYGVPAEDPETGVEGLPTDAELDPASLGFPDETAYSDLGWITQELRRDFNTIDCTDPATMQNREPAPADRGMVTCEATGMFKYILGPIEISGTHISNASSGLQTSSTGVQTGQWAVNLGFDGEGSAKFRETTTRIRTLESPRNQFAVVLDEAIITAPSVDEIIPNGEASITGDFTRIEAATLAQQLSFGALPLRFEVQSEQQVSATLGSEQLSRGLLAGALGLLLVVIYSLFQYRALGLVTVGSLVVAAILTYGVVTVLSWSQGYRLSLPGVAGLIVAIGITADSFIVYFERIRDELRDGRTLPAAVEKGWSRAKRTIIASDAVNFLAAVVLYSLAVGGVRGFAFTLGLTTLIDLLIVFCFTHPLMVLLAKTKFFGQGHPASGLDPRRLGVDGPRYVGRGKVVQAGERASKAVSDDVTPAGEPAREPAPAFGKGGPTMTIAERRAAAKAAAEQTEGNES